MILGKVLIVSVPVKESEIPTIELQNAVNNALKAMDSDYEREIVSAQTTLVVTPNGRVGMVCTIVLD